MWLLPTLPLRLPKILASLYIFTTNTVASKKKQYYLARKHRRRNSKELKNVFTKEEYVEFVDLAYRGNHEETDMGTITWAMGLSKRVKNDMIRILKEDYKGTPQTRYRAKLYASQATPRVRKAWKCYNRMLESDLTILQILESISNMNVNLWSYDELVLFDGLIDTQMTFKCIESFNYSHYYS